MFIQFQHLAGLHDERLFQTDAAQVRSQTNVLRHLPVFAVYRHEIAGPHQIQHQAQFFHRTVSGDVQRRVHTAVHHIRATLRQVVNHAEDALLITWNDARTQHHGVAGADGDVLVIIHSHAGQRGHGLALCAGDQNGGLRRLGIRHILRADEHAVRNVQQLVPMRNFRDGDHAAAHQRYLAAELVRKIQNQLQTVDRRTEAADKEAVLRPVENIFQAWAHGTLRIRVAGAVRIGGIREQQQHAALAVIRQGVQVEKLVVSGRGVHFEIARVDDYAHRGSDGQRHAAHNGMRHVDQFHAKRANRDDVLRPGRF